MKDKEGLESVVSPKVGLTGKRLTTPKYFPHCQWLSSALCFSDVLDFFNFPPSFPSSFRNFSSDGRYMCSCIYPHCIFIYRKHKWGGSGAFSLLGKIKNPQAALWPWQCKGIVFDTCKSPVLHLICTFFLILFFFFFFFKNPNARRQIPISISFIYNACPSYSLHVAMPLINGFKLIAWPSRLTFQSTLSTLLVLCAGCLYRPVAYYLPLLGRWVSERFKQWLFSKC